MAFIVKGITQMLLVPIMLLACQKPSSKEKDKQIEEHVMKNVSYGTSAAQVMDIYLPAGRDTTNTKVIFFVHGGSWNSGDKNEFDSAIPALRSRLTDCAFFNINYRLAANGVNRFPVQIEDIQSALHFIESKAGDYKINPNKIVMIGASAGAHLALLQAYKNNSDGRIKAVVDLFGPSDLTDLYYNHPVPAASQPVLTNLMRTTPAANPGLYKEASPINYVTAQTVPTLIFHGGGDYIVPITQSYNLKAKLQANNVKVNMIVYSTEGHGWYGSNLVDTYKKTISFIQENVK